MPIKLDPACLDDGHGIEETLRINKAQYHLNCKLAFNNTKLTQAQKRNSTSATDPEEGCSSKLPEDLTFSESTNPPIFRLADQK